MPTNISGTNIELTEAIKSYILEKTKPFYERYDVLDIDVEVDKNQHHRKGEVHHVRMNVSIPNDLIRSEQTETDLYAAIDICRDEVERQLQRNKEKYEAAKRKSQKTRRNLKSILSFWK